MQTSMIEIQFYKKAAQTAVVVWSFYRLKFSNNCAAEDMVTGIAQLTSQIMTGDVG